MNFIESLIASMVKGHKQIMGEYPEDIISVCIGSGSSFNIHQNVSWNKAIKLFEEYKSKLYLGKKVKNKSVGPFIMESYRTMESQSGETYCFMFPIDKVVQHDPNEVINEWIEKDRQKQGFMKELLDDLKKSRLEETNENNK